MFIINSLTLRLILSFGSGIAGDLGNTRALRLSVKPAISGFTGYGATGKDSRNLIENQCDVLADVDVIPIARSTLD